jgi:hypothetical protein
MNTSLVRFAPTVSRTALAALLGAVLQVSVQAQPDPNWLAHDRTRPQPTPVDPGSASTQDQPGKPPSDAVVLFGGEGLSAWVAMDGSPTKWVAKDGAMECVPGSGYVRTLQAFGDCQLHIEFATPAKAEGEGQGRGNSGVFFGLDRYEIQVLDSYNNKTYADGSAASVYIQYPPLVNASRPPGQWQWYDIVWTAPRFDTEGKLVSKARLTIFWNGVLVQSNVELTGPTGWLTRAPYAAHPEKLPISLQDHGNPVRYRNIWVREMKPGKQEFMLSSELLDSYCGTYEVNTNLKAEVIRGPDSTLLIKFGGAQFTLFAESPTKFFARTTDVQVEFQFSGEDKALVLSVGEGGMKSKKIR